MMKNGENPYRYARMAAGITIERAAEILDYSPRRLYAFENPTEPDIPSDQTVTAMMKFYNAWWLWYEHTRLVSTLACDNLPALDMGSLSAAYVRMCKESRDVRLQVGDTESIICDGVVEVDEKELALRIARENIEAGAAHIAFGAALSA